MTNFERAQEFDMGSSEFIECIAATLDATDLPESKLNAGAAALLAACEMAFSDLEQYEHTDLPGGYSVMRTVQTLRAAIAAARGEAGS